LLIWNNHYTVVFLFYGLVWLIIFAVRTRLLAVQLQPIAPSPAAC